MHVGTPDTCVMHVTCIIKAKYLSWKFSHKFHRSKLLIGKKLEWEWKILAIDQNCKLGCKHESTLWSMFVENHMILITWNLILNLQAYTKLVGYLTLVHYILSIFLDSSLTLIIFCICSWYIVGEFQANVKNSVLAKQICISLCSPWIVEQHKNTNKQKNIGELF